MKQETRTEHCLCVDNISKYFEMEGGRRIGALESISLNIEFTAKNKHFVVFLGPSGCGKTTLLRILAGLETPSGGSITYGGQKVQVGWAAMVFQEFSLFPWLSVRRNVEFGLKMQGISTEERSRIAVAYLREVGLEEFVDLYPHELSGGMKQRVALARSLVLDYPLILMDEPFRSLDMSMLTKIYDFVLDIWEKTPVSIFMVTHSVEEAVFFGDTIIILSAAPAHILETIPNPLTAPERRRRDENFERLVRHIKDKIQPVDDEHNGLWQSI